MNSSILAVTGSITGDRIAFYTKRAADNMAREECLLVSITTDDAEKNASERWWARAMR